MQFRRSLCVVAAMLAFSGCALLRSTGRAVEPGEDELQQAMTVGPNAKPVEIFTAAALEQTTYTTSYDASYVKLDYPNGDVPAHTGVCADVVVRAFRKVGVDLQKELHEDMTRHFGKYPAKWGARKPDRNIDHRRVPNLMTWFERQGKGLPVTKNARDYLPGDIVAWVVSDNRPHTGIVSSLRVPGAERYAIIHNIGLGARLEDVLFAWEITGHYRYFDEHQTGNRIRH
ncbi:MAG: DUF1287 domain-containing protein [Blastocatellia bacterium]|nr:DUF1287 domain-containing protein [Blastocatellia bacterium]